MGKAAGLRGRKASPIEDRSKEAKIQPSDSWSPGARERREEGLEANVRFPPIAQIRERRARKAVRFIRNGTKRD